VPNICTDTAHNTNRTASTNANEEPEDEEGCEVRRDSRGDGEDVENRERNDHDPLAAVLFRQWTPDHRTKGISYEEQGCWEDELVFAIFVKVVCNGLCCACCKATAILV
jgi:hypothetical protein